MKEIDLVILAGGKGSRIKHFLKNKPKPMLQFNKIFFLRYLINMYSKYPFKNIYILCGYKSDLIFKNFHNKNFNFCKIKCIKEKKLLGTGGALSNLKKYEISDFVLTNGDTIFDINLSDFIKSNKSNKLGSIALTHNKNKMSTKLNQLSLNKSNIIIKKRSNLMNGGIYYFKRKILDYIPNTNFSLENDLLPKLIKKKKMIGKVYNNFFLDIGSPKYLKVTERLLNKIFKKPAVFLDRDGVINYDYGYVFKLNDFIFRKGVIKGLNYLIKKNFFIFIVTNQAGIAKNKFKEIDFFKLHKQLKNILSLKNIYFDDVQYSPYHHRGVIKKYKKFSNMRKPGNKMIKNIFKNWLIDKKNSFMIGDKLSDYKCAKKSNLKFVYAENNFYQQIKKIIK